MLAWEEVLHSGGAIHILLGFLHLRYFIVSGIIDSHFLFMSVRAYRSCSNIQESSKISTQIIPLIRTALFHVYLFDGIRLSHRTGCFFT